MTPFNERPFAHINMKSPWNTCGCDIRNMRYSSTGTTALHENYVSPIATLYLIRVY